MSERLNDMLDRYGEVCPQKKAAQILSVTPRTIARMMDDGRLRRVGMHVDVRSICDYIENPKQIKTTRSTHNIPRNGPKCNGPKGRDNDALQRWRALCLLDLRLF